MTHFELEGELISSGLSPETVVRLDIPATHKHVRYLDLMSASDNDTIFPDAVVESAGQPFAYVVRKDRLGDIRQDARSLESLIRILACRSDAKYLCVVRPGAMDVYPIALTRELPDAIIDGNTLSSLTWLDLLTGAVSVPAVAKKKTSKSDEQWLEGLLFNLLTQAAKGIQKSSPRLSVDQTLALVGRALFFRFLVDRNIIGAKNLGEISASANSLAEAFATAESLAATSQWLDKTFNGDLLSMGKHGAHGLVKLCDEGISDVCWHLTNIQHNSVNGQMELDWSGIHFRHVPVDVLSQVYEDFAHEFVPDLAKQTSVHFTPRDLAEILVEGVFSAVESCPPHMAKVLDPAVGGGVFLVLALRRLVAEHWKHHGQRPGRARIRSILNTQLTGLDINHDALNVCALSLYLAALELDPKPSPISDLKFDKLLGSVLVPVDVNDLEKASDADLGSLSKQVRANFKGKFDIVVGNPPWTGWKGKNAQELERCIDELVSAGGTAEKAKAKVRTRYGSPDVAFLLAARDWAKPKGAIGFALHARLIFQPASMALRRVVFETIRVTGVMNFSALRQDKWLWPTNDAQFILLTGQNHHSEKGQDFYFISPRRERSLEKKRQFRIDPAAAIPASLRAACTIPYAFKALYKGSSLGLELIRRICDSSSMTINQALEEHGLEFASGYQLGKKLQQTRDTHQMVELPEASLEMRFEVPLDAPNFNFSKVQWPRSFDIYRGPLLLFRESPKLDRDTRGAVYAASSTVYKEHYLGISFHKKDDAEYLRDFLYILSYSNLVLYYQLLTSPKFGVERDSALQADFEGFPLIDLELVRGHERVQAIANAVRRGERPWADLDELVAEMYDLTSADQQLIGDTLATELPFVDIREQAEQAVSAKSVGEFVETFNQIISPFSQSRASPIKPLSLSRTTGWQFFAVADGDDANASLDQLPSFKILSDVASNYWVSTIRFKLPDGHQIHGRLNQARYWTRTEARLAAIDWIRHSKETHA
jgi:hypothetical protein